MELKMASERKSRLTVPTGVDPSIGTGAASRSAVSGMMGFGSVGSSTSISMSTASSSAASISPFASSMGPMQYLQRLMDVRQMDIQSALDQMKTLLSRRPHMVYKTSFYRKQTKNHWARDDPAFVALQGVFLFVACIAYAVAFRVSFMGAISFILYTVLWNWLGMGVIIATLCREIANRHLTVQQSSSHVRQQVEWLYAFDIHCNSFFPAFVVLYGIQFFLLPIVLGDSLLSLCIANSLYAIALSFYWYISHLGYRALPFLSNTEVYLFPIAAIVLLYTVMLLGYPLGFGWNASRVMARFYFM